MLLLCHVEFLSLVKLQNTLDNKPVVHQHHRLSWNNLIMFANHCLVFKIVHGLARPLHVLVTLYIRTTRAAVRGDFAVHLRYSTFSKKSFSVKDSHHWNKIPEA